MNIPKILHFIWFGYKPKYVDFCINNYKLINPSFKINVIYRTALQLESIYFNKQINNESDQLIYNIIYKIIHRTQYNSLILQQKSFLNKFGDIPFIQLLADIFRLELLNIYGGIYIDCDTFPIKPFDEKILSYNNFCVYDNVYNIKEQNNYFMGSNSLNFINNYFLDDMTPLYLTNNFMLKINEKKPFDFQIRRIKFFALRLVHDDFDDTSNYIEHYSDFSWGKKRVQFTKFDTIYC